MTDTIVRVADTIVVVQGAELVSELTERALAAAAEAEGVVASAEAARDKAQDWAEGAGEPGGTGTKSAKAWALEAAMLADQFGYRYNYGPYTPTQFTDSAGDTQRPGYIETSVSARSIYQGAATAIRVHGFTSAAADFPDFAELGVESNGAYIGSIKGTSNGFFFGDLTLPAGSKTLTIINGLKSRPSATEIGTFLVSVEANAPLTQTFPAVVNRTLFIVDSIGATANAKPGTQFGYINRLRRVTTDSLVSLGYGYATFMGLAGTPELRQALVAKIVALGVKEFVITLGTNDYFFNSGTGPVGTAYAALVDAVYAADPTIRTFAVTPIIRSDEVSQVGGATIQDYRNAITNAVNGKPRVTVVDGKAFMTAQFLADGVHPNNAGHLKWAQGIAPYLGYTVPDDAVNPLNAGPDANGTVTTPSAGVYRATKQSGGFGFNAGFFGAPRTGNFRYAVKIPAFQEIMIGVNPNAAAGSGFADMQEQIFANAGGGLQRYTGSNMVGQAGSYVEGDTVLVDRTGSTLTFKKGEDWDSGTVLGTPVTGVSGTLALDLSLASATAGTYVDVRQLV